MKTNGTARVQKNKAHLRKKKFPEECKRQSLLAKKSTQEQEIIDFIADSADLRDSK